MDRGTVKMVLFIMSFFGVFFTGTEVVMAASTPELAVDTPSAVGNYWEYEAVAEYPDAMASRTDRLESGKYRLEIGSKGEVIADELFLEEIMPVFIHGNKRRCLTDSPKVGESWQFKYNGGLGSRWVYGTASVDEKTTITVPAGTFEVYKISCSEPGAGLYADSEVISTRFYSVEIKMAILVESYLLTSLGNKRNQLRAELLSYKVSRKSK